jgi:hypothetical protein
LRLPQQQPPHSPGVLKMVGTPDSTPLALFPHIDTRT